ncbi:MAG TPA: dihydrolipoyllysine-residue succinyltransferase, partial [Verrucomicrobiae bacterium]|nr:dihydrolipoyllysine-residue succinyltransferase [Verrucomicrobiae bacterium]
MSIELKVPEIGESITEVEIGEWLKKEGDAVKKDETVVALESEKATVDLPAPEDGTISKVLKQKGEVAKVGEVIAHLETGKGESTSTKSETKAAEKTSPAKTERKTEERRDVKTEKAPAEAASKPRSQQRSTREEPESSTSTEENIEPRESQTSGAPGREEEIVPMSRLRRTVAERLVEAQRNAALLTTFNEIDMAEVMQFRKEYGEAFQSKHNVKLGFMSFFVKATIEALKQFPALNAEVRGTDIVYRNYYDIGVAIGSGKGLVVPVLRHAERMSFAEIEQTIGDFGRRAKENKLKIEELQGGTFTISNGGVYGSLLSTPIVNPPQSGVLGM